MKYNFWNDTLPESRIDKIVRQDPMILLRRAIETPRDAITIGEDLRTGRDVRLSLKEHLGTHLHICGATGTGKTRGGVELIVKHLIINPARGGCLLLTPHDDVFRQTLEYCAHLHMKRPELRLHERVIPIDFDDPRRIVGFNVAARNARTFSYQVATFVDSILKC